MTADTRIRRIHHLVNRIVIEVDATYDDLRRRFEELVPAIGQEGLAEVVATGDVAAMERYTAERTPNSFANFWTLDATAAMRLKGNRSQLVTYMVGNNVIAETMYRHDPGVMLYAPIRTAIYTDGDGRTFLSFDQPSTRFGSFDDEDIRRVGRLLDGKFASLLGLLGVPVPAELTADGGSH
jgi:hypothetical protein